MASAVLLAGRRRSTVRLTPIVLAAAFAGLVALPIVGDRNLAGFGLRLLELMAMTYSLNLITGFSLMPMRALSLTGMGIFLFDAIFAAVLLGHRLIYGPQQEGALWTLFAVLFFFVGLVFLALGLIGEYIGRIYIEVRRRPNYIVRAVHGEGAADRGSHPPPG